MLDARKLLDALVAAVAHGGGQPRQGTREVMGQNRGLAEAAILSLAGLLLGSRRSQGIASNLARLGGLALIGGLAYRAFQNSSAGQPAHSPAGARTGQATPGPGPSQQDVAQSLSAMSVPESSGFHPASQTEDDALLYLRAMVAAAAADGHLDQAERARIMRGLAQAGIDPEATGWLEREMEAPLDVEELSASVNTPEKATQVYAAARIAIDPDTIQEREFLRQLASALDLDESLKAQLDSTATALKVGGAG